MCDLKLEKKKRGERRVLKVIKDGWSKKLNVNCIVNGCELKETLMLKALNENVLSKEFM